VAEQVRSDKRVKSHRLGDRHEGGSGVTIVELES
jgi:dsDNA-specific endonuclease/ATPase MutS2